jgi:hypothetical protein
MSVLNLADERQLRHSDAPAAELATDRAELTASLLREKELLSEMSVNAPPQPALTPKCKSLKQGNANDKSLLASR